MTQDFAIGKFESLSCQNKTEANRALILFKCNHNGQTLIYKPSTGHSLCPFLVPEGVFIPPPVLNRVWGF